MCYEFHVYEFPFMELCFYGNTFTYELPFYGTMFFMELRLRMTKQVFITSF